MSEIERRRGVRSMNLPEGLNSSSSRQAGMLDDAFFFRKDAAMRASRARKDGDEAGELYWSTQARKWGTIVIMLIALGVASSVILF